MSLLIKNSSLWLVVPTISLLFGQALAASSSISPASLSGLLFFPLIFFFWRPIRFWALLFLLVLAALWLGYARHFWMLHPTLPSNHVRQVMSEDARLHIEGVLYQEPERTEQRSRWVVRSQRVWHPAGAEEIRGYLLITIRHAAREWRYGDRIRFEVRPRIPRDFGNPGGFDYASYLARRRIYATGFLESDEGVELLARGSFGFWHAIEHLRREIRRFIDKHFSHESGALMKALTVGDMGGISREMRADFTAAGVNHVLSISGLHVGMLGLVVFFLVRSIGLWSTVLLLRWNLLKVAAFFSFLAVLFYTALAGAMVPTVRSAIMIGVYEMAVLLDREEELLSSLTFAALLIGLAWPGVIMDISFQLSFLAILFIIWGIRKAQEWWPSAGRDELPEERSWLGPRIRRVGLYLAVPVLATLGTGPMIAHHFGNLSLAGFASNPLLVPFVGFLIVPLGLALGVLALIWPPLALSFVWLAEPLASLVLWSVQLFSRLPLASLSVPIPNLFEVSALYLFILSFFLVRRRYLMALAGVLALAAPAAGIYWWKERWDRNELRITYLSVGHGDAAVVEFPGSRVLLIDAGGTATGEFDTGEAIVAPFLRSRKILKVDYLLLSHQRIDHYGGMRAVVEEFSPTEFWSGAGRGRTSRYEELERALERAGTKRVYLNRNDPCRAIDRAELCVLHPAAGTAGDVSLVVRLAYGGVRLLFPGDIEGKDEEALLRSGADLSSAVIKVPRHGSLGSSTAGFVAAVRPRLAVFSVGERNPFGLPRDEVIARYLAAGCEILRTDRDGAIVIETDGKRLRYRTYGSGKRGEINP